jgi:hypothetical protein
MYGLFDTKDNCWFGDADGPREFEDFMLARCAAQMVETQIMGSDLGGRIVAREIPEEEWHLKDEVPVKRTALKALQVIEGKIEKVQ